MPEDYKTKSADPDVIDTKLNWSPIVAAINQSPLGFQEAIYELLRAKADPNLVVEDKTPLMWAARANQYEVIKILQKYGGNINQATD